MTKRGRPTEYTTDLPDKLRSYTKDCLSKQRIPWIEEFCNNNEISDRTLRDWCKAHDELGKAREHLMMVQRMILKQLCISKGTHAAGPIFLLKANHGFIETEKVQHTGPEEEPLTLIFTDSATYQAHEANKAKREQEESRKQLEAQKTKETENVGGYDWTPYINKNSLTQQG
ncbi:MAG: hypothetical protein HY430_01570 [Candidatus Levybacteria bacterium]|nr:hypothetical protein [Candidatus Levybacteria bacterium]